MLAATELHRKLESVFDADQAKVLAEVITAAYSDLVRTSDFSELKGIVRDLGVKVGELAEAQNRTEIRVEELAVAQKQTTEEVRSLSQDVRNTNRELRGLGLSFGYALENEACRMVPALLAEHYGIEITEKLLRTEFAGEEVNLFGRGVRSGRPVLVVGEAKARLSMRPGHPEDAEPSFGQLDRKVEAVHAELGEADVVPVLVTHFATRAFLEEAAKRGVIVLQSHEW
jgi:hypothetical protein